MPSSTRIGFADIVVWLCLGLVVVSMSVAAYLSFPVYDDAYIALMIDHGSADSAALMPDRPLMGYLFQAAVDSGNFRLVGALANGITLLLTALVTKQFWTTLYPNYRRYWPTASMLATAPILSELSATLTLIFQLQTALVYFIALWIWPRCDRRVGPLRIAIAVALIGGLGSISEYPISGCAAAAALMFVTRGQFSLPLRTVLPPVCGILVGATLGYVLFRTFADAGFRDGVSPLDGLGFLLSRGWTIPLKLTDYLSATTGAAVFREFAQFTVRTRIGFYSAAVASLITLAITAYFFLRRSDDERTATLPDAAPSALTWVQLMIAIATGLMPLLGMGLVLNDDFADSRFYLGVLPLSACATLALPLCAVRSHYRIVIVCLLVWVSGYFALSDAVNWVRSHQTLVSIGDEIHPLLAGDFTLVLVDLREAPYRPLTRQLHDLEMTATMTSTWSNPDKQRVWMIPVSYGETPPITGTAKPWGVVTPPDSPTESWKFARYVRGINVEKPVSRVLLLTYYAVDKPRITDVTSSRVILK